MTKAEEVAALMNNEPSCLTNSQDDEPVFILVARDEVASDTVRHWSDMVEARAAGQGKLTKQLRAKLAEARALAAKMVEWRNTHVSKLPD